MFERNTFRIPEKVYEMNMSSSDKQVHPEAIMECACAPSSRTQGM